MAKEYIDREAFMENVRLKYCNDCTSYNGLRCSSCWVDDMEDAIEDAPIADVAEVRHGTWKEHFAFGCWHYDCPFCDEGYSTKEKDETPPNYCQDCGAKMDGKEGAENANT